MLHIKLSATIHASPVLKEKSCLSCEIFYFCEWYERHSNDLWIIQILFSSNHSTDLRMISKP